MSGSMLGVCKSIFGVCEKIWGFVCRVPFGLQLVFLFSLCFLFLLYLLLPGRQLHRTVLDNSRFFEGIGLGSHQKLKVWGGWPGRGYIRLDLCSNKSYEQISDAFVVLAEDRVLHPITHRIRCNRCCQWGQEVIG